MVMKFSSSLTRSWSNTMAASPVPAAYNRLHRWLPAIPRHFKCVRHAQPAASAEAWRPLAAADMRQRRGKRSWAVFAASPATEPEPAAEPDPDVEVMDDELAEDDATVAELEALLTPRTFRSPILTPDEVFDALYERMHHTGLISYRALYSSHLGGIVTEPPLMIIALDDHMVHRGHAVFDTALIVDGHLYQLDAHLERFLQSAEAAGLYLPYNLEQTHRIMLETAAAGEVMNGAMRFWVSAGRGGFGLSSAECVEPGFYCQVYVPSEPEPEPLNGVRVKTSEVPHKPQYFAQLKSNNYLPNVLCKMDAEATGFDHGIFVDSEGFVAEGGNVNVAIITQQNELWIPPFDNCLAGCTMQRLIDLIPRYIRTADLPDIDTMVRRKFTVEQAKQARDVFITGSSLPVMPVLEWDKVIIARQPGRSVMALAEAIRVDMDPNRSEGQHTRIPYGYLTRADIKEHRNTTDL